MGLNKPLGHGIQCSSMLLFNLAFIILSLIPPCLFITVALLYVICWYMWMILCLLEMIPALCSLLLSSLVINFRWKIWVLLIIFWAWKLSPPVQVYSCPNINMSVTCCPKPAWLVPRISLPPISWHIFKTGWWHCLCWYHWIQTSLWESSISLPHPTWYFLCCQQVISIHVQANYYTLDSS